MSATRIGNGRWNPADGCLCSRGEHYLCHGHPVQRIGNGRWRGSTGGVLRFTGGSTALPVTINQCNGSGNGGGSTVTCTTTITNNFLSLTTVTTPTSPSGTSPAPSSGSGGTGTPAAAGGVGSWLSPTGLTGSAPGAGGSTGTSPVGALGVVPSGGPQTGLGGASHSRDSNLLFAAALLFLGAGLDFTIAVRRRRNFSVQGANESTMRPSAWVAEPRHPAR